MLDINLLIDDRDVAASTGATFERRDPITGDVASRAAAASVADAQAAADAAAAAFPAWSKLGPNARRAALLKAADLLEGRAADFVNLMATEIGATAGWAQFNVKLAAGMLREAASLTTQITGEIIPSDKPGCVSMAVRQPAGVVLGIAPWNAPVILGVRAIATPLACGNTVVLKASEICPGTHRLIGAVLREAGLPAGVVNVITNAPEDAGEIIESLIAHPAVRRINFTGSTRVGRIIAETAARFLKPVLLELGGKASLVVLDDADLDAAVAASAFGAFMNQGQICMSTERIVVDNTVADDFVAKLAAKAESLQAGNPRHGNFALGSLVGVEAAERIGGLVNDAVSKGAKLAGRRTGGRHGDVRDGSRPSHPGHAPLWRGILRSRRLRHPRVGRGGGGPHCQRHGVRALRRRLRARHHPGARCGAPDRFRHLPHQRGDGARRGPDAVRRREGERIRPVRRQGRHQRVHRAALDHHRDRPAAFSDLRG